MRYFSDFFVTQYYKMPGSFRNLFTSFYGIVKKRKEYNKNFYQQYNKLLETENYSDKQIEELQLINLRNQIDYIYENVPYYTKLFDDHGIAPSQIQNRDDIRKIPLLDKKIIRENFNELISTKINPDKLVYEITSGTTGTPFRIGMDTASFYFADAIQMIMWKWAGFNFCNDWIARLAGNKIVPLDTRKPPYWTKNYTLKQMHFSSYHLNEKNALLYYNQIMKNNIHFISGYPSTIALFASFLLCNNVSLKLKAVFVSSEPTYSFQKDLIEKVFCCRVFNIFGQAERVLTTVSCGASLDMHYFEQSVVLDFEETNGQDKSLVVSSLINKAMPLINYKLNDLTEDIGKKCSCGRNHKTISPVMTKEEDVVLTPEGYHISASLITFPFKNIAGVTEGQIVQKTLDEIVVNVVADVRFKRSQEETLISDLKSVLGKNVNIKVERVHAIPRTKNGKFRFVISELKDSKKQ